MTRHHHHKGFTLVEVLVAITIFAIAVSTLFASFNLVISKIDPINTGLDDYDMARTALDRIQKDLAGLCLTHYPAYRAPEQEKMADPDRFRVLSSRVSLDGKEFSQLRIASFGHLSFNREPDSRIGILTYYVAVSADGSPVLKRSDIGINFYDDTQENARANDPIVCKRVLAFELTFIDQEGNLHEAWDSDAPGFDFATPFAIQVSLTTGTLERPHDFSTTVVLPTYREKNET